MSRTPLLFSHRTQMGTCPENTLGGIRAAIEARVDGIEVDVRAARDGTPMLLHDASLERTTGDPRLLAEVAPASARRRLVRGPEGRPGEEGVPTLAAALRAVAGRCLLVIEVKEPGLGPAVATRVRAERAAEWCWIWSFWPEIVAELRAALPEVPVSLNVGAPTPVDAAIREAVRLGAAGISLQHSLVTPRVVRDARRRGLSVYTWTVNDRRVARAMIAADVDAVCSDFPERTVPPRAR